MRTAITLLFLAGLLINGLLGFGTSMTFSWPGYLFLGIAAAVSGFLLLRKNGSNSVPGATPTTWCLGSALLLTGFVAARARLSPVAYFARGRRRS